MAEIRKNKTWSKELIKMKVGEKFPIPFEDKDLAGVAANYLKNKGLGLWSVLSNRSKKTAKIIRLE